jgi:hypothetical protein
MIASRKMTGPQGGAEPYFIAERAVLRVKCQSALNTILEVPRCSIVPGKL